MRFQSRCQPGLVLWRLDWGQMITSRMVHMAVGRRPQFLTPGRRFALEPLYRILECPHDVTAGERASDPRERAVEPQYLFWSQKSLAVTFSVFFWSHRWAWYSVGGDYARILRHRLGWRLITALHEPTPAPLLLMSLNGLLLRPKSWESSLTLSSHILIQSISKSCQLIFRLP